MSIKSKISVLYIISFRVTQFSNILNSNIGWAEHSVLPCYHIFAFINKAEKKTTKIKRSSVSAYAMERMRISADV